MPTNWDAVNAQCPFYLTETINTITCEGIIGQTDVHGFHLRAVKAEHKNKFCNRCFKRCKYYIALIDEKYPEEKPSTKKRWKIYDVWNVVESFTLRQFKDANLANQER